MICITHVSRKCMILNQSKYVCFVERKGSEVIASIIGCSDVVPCLPFYLILFSHKS